MNLFGKKPQEVYYLPTPTTKKYSNPANPTRKKLGRKLDISGFSLYDGSFIDDEIVRHQINPLNVVKDAVQTELVDGVQILKFSDRVEKIDVIKQSIDSTVREELNNHYAKILLSFLKNARNISVDSKSLCGEELNFMTGIKMIFEENNDKTVPKKIVGLYSINKDFPNKLEITIGNRPNDVIFDINDFSKRFPGIMNPTKYISEEKYNETKKIISYIFNSYNNAQKFETLRNEFSKCTNPYYVIPIVYIQSFGDGEGSGGHQNLLLLDKLNQAAVYIEPEFYGTSDMDIQKRQSGRIHNTIDRILKELNIPEYKHVIPVTPYPQSITDDTNCMFWTFLITVNYIVNTKSISPDQIANAIIKKYPTREQLLEYIEGFKEKLYFYVRSMQKLKGISTFAGRRKIKRKTIRRKRRST